MKLSTLTIENRNCFGLAWNSIMQVLYLAIQFLCTLVLINITITPHKRTLYSFLGSLSAPLFFLLSLENAGLLFPASSIQPRELSVSIRVSSPWTMTWKLIPNSRLEQSKDYLICLPFPGNHFPSLPAIQYLEHECLINFVQGFNYVR